MLSHLRIQNFKSWRDTGRIRLAPITVLFGSNSSGKSSLSQFLLLLQQTAQSPDRHRVLHPGDDQTPVDLGTFRDMVFDHDERLPIELDLGWSLSEDLVVKDSRTTQEYRGHNLQFEAEIRGLKSVDTRVVVDRMSYGLFSSEGEMLRVGMQRGAAAKGQYQLFAEGIKLIRNPGRGWPLPAPLRFYGFPDEAIAYYQNAAFLSDLTLALERQLGRIYYLGPLREYPRRYYTWAGVTPEHVGWRGERSVEALLAARDRKLSPGPRKHGLSFEKLIAQRPEIHLHPRVQAELADLFIDVIRSREDGEARRIQLIVESHSEHFLRRLQRRIAEERIRPEEAALYFVEAGPKGHSSLHSLDLDEYGNISNWPEDFFGDEIGDLTAMTQAAMQRRKR